MPIRNAQSEFRNVTVSITYAVPATNLPIDAIKAATNKIEEIEGQYFKNPSSVTDLAGAAVIVTGTQNFQVHVFNVTTTIATGTYGFEYVETVPTPADVS